METIQLFDNINNEYKYMSRGRVEYRGVFWEVLENRGDTSPYCVVWCNEDGVPTSAEELFDKCIFIDDREDDRRIYTNRACSLNVMSSIVKKAEVELGV